jgi:hypothetical protein
VHQRAVAGRGGEPVVGRYHIAAYELKAVEREPLRPPLCPWGAPGVSQSEVRVFTNGRWLPGSGSRYRRKRHPGGQAEPRLRRRGP